MSENLKFGQSGPQRLAHGGFRVARQRRVLRAAAVCVLAALVGTGVAGSPPALGQGWGGWIPWGGEQRTPAPREPVRPQPAPPPAYIPPAGTNQSSVSRPPICVQLEQRLHAESRSSTARDLLPRLENDIRAAERAGRAAQEQLEKGNCYEYEFLVFGKQLRRTPACINQSQQVESSRRRVAELDQQRQQIVQSGGRSLQDDLIRELARNNCGAHYQQQAARNSNPFSALWQDGDSGAGGSQFNYGATFRTVCVRLCDGAFFPVSFSTLPNNFDRDQDLCQQRCAAPAELYYHSQHPGQGIEQAISHKTRQPYTSLRTAFRFRKEFVAGCSCKAAEFAPAASSPAVAGPGDRRAEGPPAAGGPAGGPAGGWAPTPARR
jgi:hypothetical protein